MLIVADLVSLNKTHSFDTEASYFDFRLYDGSDLKTYLLMRW